MHGDLSPKEFLQGIAGLLAAYYFALAGANALAACHPWKAGLAASPLRLPWLRLAVRPARLWLLVAAAFAVMGAICLAGRVHWLSLPLVVCDRIDQWAGPVVISAGTLLLLLGAFWLREFLVSPCAGWMILNLVLLAMGLSLTDADFARIVTKPDNVAIVAMLFLLGFFTWLGARRAVENDARIARGEETREQQERERFLVWPDLVYVELICMLALAAVLIFWGLAVKAPLEEPASSVKTPNPSKAPWYFVGLQEMLYYFDPWMAGVVLPGLIILGLMAIPYLDCNPRGNGYYTIHERRFAYLTFHFGFLVLWILLIVLGTFFRGPNWSFFGPYEAWDVHKVTAASHYHLSQYFWDAWRGAEMPQVPAEATGWSRFLHVLWRESPGIVLLLLYFVLPPFIAPRVSRAVRELRATAGIARYLVICALLLTMALLPIKMVARWAGHIQYFVALPEYFLSF